MSSTVLVQTNGFGAVSVWSMWLPTTASRLAVVRNAPRRRQRRVSSENQHSTRLSQDDEAGAKCSRLRLGIGRQHDPCTQDHCLTRTALPYKPHAPWS